MRPGVTIELAERLRERVEEQVAAARNRRRGNQVSRGMWCSGGSGREGGAGATAPAGAIDLLVELDDRLPTGRAAGKLERYDHLLAGWSVHTRRTAAAGRAARSVVFVCRDRARARECARRADSVLSACRAYAGEYPADWEYPGRERILFVAERDAHEGLLHAYGVPRLPPEVRVSVAHGDPRAGEAVVEVRELVAITRVGE